MSLGIANGSKTEIMTKDSITPTLLYSHAEKHTSGDRTTDKLWGLVRDRIGVVIETETLETESKSLLTAQALNLYVAAPDTTLHFETGVRDAQGSAVTKISSSSIQAGVYEIPIEGLVEEAEQQAVADLTDAYVLLAMSGLRLSGSRLSQPRTNFGLTA